jgi:catechol 2,3-dioxygenase-like lactoylglutathione lyase family enzyme
LRPVIQHVTRDIRPSELGRCSDFYRQLGFDPVPVPPGIEGRAVWLERAGTQIHLMFVDEAVAAARPPSGHVGIVVAEYPATVAGLEAAGHRVEPRQEHWGAARSYVRDPAGHLVELMAAPPPAQGE